MDAFQLFPAKWKFEFNIKGSIRIMGQLDMIMKAEFFCGYPKTFMPFLSLFFPIVIPLHLCAWPNEKLHFHLFKFTHAKNKLPCYNFIAESFSGLCNTERN